jgi:hypothetical protein
LLVARSQHMMSLSAVEVDQKAVLKKKRLHQKIDEGKTKA